MGRDHLAGHPRRRDPDGHHLSSGRAVEPERPARPAAPAVTAFCFAREAVPTRPPRRAPPALRTGPTSARSESSRGACPPLPLFATVPLGRRTDHLPCAPLLFAGVVMLRAAALGDIADSLPSMATWTVCPTRGRRPCPSRSGRAVAAAVGYRVALARDTGEGAGPGGRCAAGAGAFLNRTSGI
jgi:hypothetical protein